MIDKTMTSEVSTPRLHRIFDFNGSILQLIVLLQRLQIISLGHNS